MTIQQAQVTLDKLYAEYVKAYKFVPVFAAGPVQFGITSRTITAEQGIAILKYHRAGKIRAKPIKS